MVQDSAVSFAVEQATLRHNIADAYVNLGSSQPESALSPARVHHPARERRVGSRDPRAPVPARPPRDAHAAQCGVAARSRGLGAAAHVERAGRDGRCRAGRARRGRGIPPGVHPSRRRRASTERPRPTSATSSRSSSRMHCRSRRRTRTSRSTDAATSTATSSRSSTPASGCTTRSSSANALISFGECAGARAVALLGSLRRRPARVTTRAGRAPRGVVRRRPDRDGRPARRTDRDEERARCRRARRRGLVVRTRRRPARASSARAARRGSVPDPVDGEPAAPAQPISFRAASSAPPETGPELQLADLQDDDLQHGDSHDAPAANDGFAGVDWQHEFDAVDAEVAGIASTPRSRRHRSPSPPRLCRLRPSRNPNRSPHRRRSRPPRLHLRPVLASASARSPTCGARCSPRPPRPSRPSLRRSTPTRRQFPPRLRRRPRFWPTRIGPRSSRPIAVRRSPRSLRPSTARRRVGAREPASPFSEDLIPQRLPTRPAQLQVGDTVGT